MKTIDKLLYRFYLFVRLYIPLDRRKITINNVNDLIERLEKIQHLDLAELLRNYYPLPFSLSAAPSTETRNQVKQRANISDFLLVLIHRTSIEKKFFSQ